VADIICEFPRVPHHLVGEPDLAPLCAPHLTCRPVTQSLPVKAFCNLKSGASDGRKSAFTSGAKPYGANWLAVCY
jgi:hypothetical protein